MTLPDPAVEEAQRLWRDKQPKEAMLVLVRRIDELAGRSQNGSGTRHLFLKGAVAGALLVGVLVAAAFGGISLLTRPDDKPDTESPGVIALSESPIPTNSPETIPSVTAVPPTITPTEEIPATEMVPAGEWITYPGGSLRVLQFQRPVAATVARVDSSDQLIAKPVRGAEFVGVEVEFTCGLTFCYSAPGATFALGLEGGYIASGMDFLDVHRGIYPEDMANGATVSGWLVFEIPINATASEFIIRPLSGSPVSAGLPHPIDGFSVPQTWDSALDIKPSPVVAYALQAAGIDVFDLGVYLQRSDQKVYLVVPIVTSEVIYFDEWDVLNDTREALQVIVEVNGQYGEGVNGVLMFLYSPYRDATAHLRLDSGDLGAYVSGTISFEQLLTRAVVSIE